MGETSRVGVRDVLAAAIPLAARHGDPTTLLTDEELERANARPLAEIHVQRDGDQFKQGRSQESNPVPRGRDAPAQRPDEQGA